MLLKWGLSISLTPCACDFSPRWRPTWERGFPRLYELTTRQVLHQQAPHHVPVKKDKLVSKGPRRAGHREPGEGTNIWKKRLPSHACPCGTGLHPGLCTALLATGSPCSPVLGDGLALPSPLDRHPVRSSQVSTHLWKSRLYPSLSPPAAPISPLLSRTHC